MKEQLDIAKEYVINEIISHRIAPGNVLYETVVAEKLSMSRTPVRQALNDVVSIGILEHLKGKRGYTLPALSRKDMLDVFNTRKTIEMQAVEEASANNFSFNDSHIKSILLLIEREKEAIEAKDRFAYTIINRNIHSKLVELSRNIYLSRIFLPLFWRASLYDFYFSTFYNDIVHVVPSVFKGPDEHYEIVQAICDANITGAKHSIEVHIVPTIERYLKIYSSQGE